MPDISVLPILADYFDVSADELLGLKPLKGDVYSSEEIDSEKFWNNHIEYIMRSKNGNWNNDYLGFLVSEVWKINKPVSVLNCGCGNANFALLLMKYLPKGSSYAGIDFSSALTEQAEKILIKYNINGQIVKGDFLESNFKDKFNNVASVDCRKNRWLYLVDNVV